MRSTMINVAVRTVLLAAAPFAAIHPAAAATPTSANDRQGSGVEEIVVTASRAGLPGYTASTPTTVVSSQTLETEGAQNFADVLERVPGFRAFQTPGSNGPKTALTGSASADLRGLGAQRTLVLVDGLRVQPSAASTNTSTPNFVDLDSVPSIMIESADIVTGGASAQWGSDAVAGVVNIKLLSDFEGLRVKTQYGRSESGGNDRTYFGLLGGTHFGPNEHGRFVIGSEYQKDTGIGDIYTNQRDHSEAQILSNPNSATNGLPSLILSDGVHTALGAGGLITGPANFPLKNYTFNSDGTIRPFQVGSFVSGAQMIGGEGVALLNGFSQVPSLQRSSTYAKAYYDITGSITAFTTLAYSESKGNIHGSAPRITGRNIRVDNPFLPQAVRDAMTAQGLATISFQRSAFDLSNPNIFVTDKDPRAAVGMEGFFGSSGKWDVSYEHGEDRYHQDAYNATNGVALAFALDATTDANGNPVCRATLPGASFQAAAAGCVPINLFGAGRASPDAVAYVQNTGVSDSRYKQDDVTANIKGTPVSTWAGEVAVAAGAEYRKENQNVTANAPAAAGVFLGAGSASPYSGSFSVKEGYVDSIIPLMTDLAFAKSLMLNAAYRYEDYSSIGGQSVWKAGLDYKPVEGLRLRATHSRDIRAPALYELFSGGQPLVNLVTVRGKTVNIPLNVTLGNPTLLPEDASTTTGGFVFTPGGVLNGLTMSVDFYRVNITNAITSLSTATIGNLCTQGNQQFCNMFTFDATGTATSLNASVLNAASLDTRGLDMDLRYVGDMPALFGRASSFSTSLRGVYTFHSYLSTGGGAPTIDRAGELGPQNLAAVPRLRMNGSQTLHVGDLSLTLQEIFTAKGRIDNTFVTFVPGVTYPTTVQTINDNHVPSILQFNLFSNYSVTERLQVSLSVRNLLDKAPPVTPNPNLPIPPFNGQWYDTVGRAFGIGFVYEPIMRTY